MLYVILGRKKYIYTIIWFFWKKFYLFIYLFWFFSSPLVSVKRSGKRNAGDCRRSRRTRRARGFDRRIFAAFAEDSIGGNRALEWVILYIILYILK